MPTVSEIHRWTRPFVEAALSNTYISQFPLAVRQVLQGIGMLETGCGYWWKGAGVGSNNWGAIQSGHPPCVGGFIYTDTHPNADGSSTPYQICFRKYSTPEEGATALSREIYIKRPKVLAAAVSENIYGVSTEMHASRYYEGFGKTVADRIAHHYNALSNAIRQQAAALQEKLPPLPPPLINVAAWKDDFLPDNPLVMSGMHGTYVLIWQRILSDWLVAQGDDGIVVDGAFGPITTVETKRWQKTHGLKADGKVGHDTWSKAAE